MRSYIRYIFISLFIFFFIFFLLFLYQFRFESKIDLRIFRLAAFFLFAITALIRKKMNEEMNEV